MSLNYTPMYAAYNNVYQYNRWRPTTLLALIKSYLWGYCGWDQQTKMHTSFIVMLPQFKNLQNFLGAQVGRYVSANVSLQHKLVCFRMPYLWNLSWIKQNSSDPSSLNYWDYCIQTLALTQLTETVQCQINTGCHMKHDIQWLYSQIAAIILQTKMTKSWH